MSSDRPSEVVWRRARRCADNACVEVAVDRGCVVVRGSGRTGGTELRFGASGWAAFLAAVRAGRFAAN